MHVLHQADEIARPADRDRGRRQAVLEQQQQPHDPGGPLAHGGVGVGIGRAGHRQGRGEFGVAEGDERAEHAGDHEGDHDRRAGELRRRPAGEHEDAGADDAADAQEHEVQGAERTLQLPVLELGLDLGDGFAQEDAPKAKADA